MVRQQSNNCRLPSGSLELSQGGFSTITRQSISRARSSTSALPDSGSWYIASEPPPSTQLQSTAFRLSSQPAVMWSRTTLPSTKNLKKSCNDTMVNYFRCTCTAPGRRPHVESEIQIELNGAK